MAKAPRDQQKTDERRVPPAGTGKLDHQGVPAAKPMDRASTDEARGAGDNRKAPDATGIESARERIEAERQAAIEQLRALGVSSDGDDMAPHSGADVVRDAGDASQASESRDMSFARRERLAERIKRLTAALERIQQDRYGICAMCGHAIEPARLAAAPDADVCRQCQERRERGAEPDAAA